MSTDEHKSLLKVRTYANDLLRDKKKAGLAITEDEFSAGKKEKEKPGAPEQAEQKETVPKKETSDRHKFNAVKKKQRHERHTVTVERKTLGQAVLEYEKEEEELAKKKPEVDTVPKSIPAFHELHTAKEKDIEFTAHSTKKVAPKKLDRSFTSSTTVITAKRHPGEGFLARILKSVTDWVSSLKKSTKKKRTSAYTVQDTDYRKGVIQKATTKTGTLFTADSSTLRDEIRRRQAKQRSQHEGPDIDWSPNTEPGYALLEGPDSEVSPAPPSTSIPEKVQDTTEYPAQAPAPEDTVLPPIQIIEPSTAAEPPQEIEVPLAPAPRVAVATDIPVEVTIPKTAQPVEATAPVAISEADLIPPKVTPPIDPIKAIVGLVTGQKTFAETNTNSLAMGAAAILALVCILVIAVRVLIGLLAPDPQLPQVDMTSTPIIETVSVSQVEVDLSNSFVSELLRQVDESATTNFHEAAVTDLSGQLVPPGALLEFLDISVDSALSNSVTKLHFVVIDQTKRGLVLEVSDSASVLGTLFTWERTMYGELAPLMRLASTSAQATFVDATIYDTDIRVLNDRSRELLVYGFITENVVLIVPDVVSFERALIEQF